MNYARKIKRQNQIAESKVRRRERRRKKREQVVTLDTETHGKGIIVRTKDGREIMVDDRAVTKEDILKALKELGDNV